MGGSVAATLGGNAAYSAGSAGIPDGGRPENGGEPGIGGEVGMAGQAGECKNGEPRCSEEGQPQLCDGGVWIDQADCDSVSCSEATGKCGKCQNGQRRCQDDIPQFCADGVWTNQAACDGSSCDNQTGKCGSCVNGARQCEDSTPQLCTGTTWVDETTCSGAKPVCHEGACVECSPGTKRCMGKATQLCSASGTWQPPNDCEYVCTGAGNCTGSCSPGNTQCNSNTPQMCGSSGQWVNGTTCDPTKSLCDAGSGTCKKLDGQPCSAGADCTSTACSDGYCCDTKCTGTCESCNLPGKRGTCSIVTSGPDADSCATSRSCDVSGTCKALDGQSCDKTSDCVSGSCTTFYRDGDLDGYGAGSAVKACGTSPPSGYAANNTDCCDSDSRAYPGEMSGAGSSYYGSYQSANKCGSFDYDCSGSASYTLGTGQPCCDASCTNGPCYICSTIACGTCAPLYGAGCVVNVACNVDPWCK